MLRALLGLLLLGAAVPARGNPPPPVFGPEFVRGEAGLAKGRFLVAARQLQDPNFSETVVLLIEYGENGAIGLIVNRPSDAELRAVLPDMEGLRKREDVLFIGGPVARSRISVLIRSKRAPQGATKVFDETYFSLSKETLRRLVDAPRAGERFRLYAGYAGWAPGQLDAEVARGDWKVLPGDAAEIFENEPSEVWRTLIGRAAGRWTRGPVFPRHRWSAVRNCTSLPKTRGHCGRSASHRSDRRGRR